MQNKTKHRQPRPHIARALYIYHYKILLNHTPAIITTNSNSGVHVSGYTGYTIRHAHLNEWKSQSE